MAARAVALVAVSMLSCLALSGCSEDGLFLGREAPYPAVDADELDLETDSVTGLRLISTDELPATALATLALVEAGGPFPHPEDGSPYTDPDGRLPDQASGYYRSYSVAKPGENGPSPWHLVVGQEDEVFWTVDDYATLRRVQD